MILNCPENGEYSEQEVHMCKIKTFRDKGADRKFRDEIRRCLNKIEKTKKKLKNNDWEMMRAVQKKIECAGSEVILSCEGKQKGLFNPDIPSI
jgi:hypothetical protein